MIQVQGSVVTIQPRDGSAPIFVNKQQVGASTVRPGDLVQFGKTEFKIEVDAAASATAGKAQQPVPPVHVRRNYSKSAWRLLSATKALHDRLLAKLREDGRLRVFREDQNYFDDRHEYPYYIYVNARADGQALSDAEEHYIDALIRGLSEAALEQNRSGSRTTKVAPALPPKGPGESRTTRWTSSDALVDVLAQMERRVQQDISQLTGAIGIANLAIQKILTRIDEQRDQVDVLARAQSEEWIKQAEQHVDHAAEDEQKARLEANRLSLTIQALQKSIRQIEEDRDSIRGERDLLQQRLDEKSFDEKNRPQCADPLGQGLEVADRAYESWTDLTSRAKAIYPNLIFAPKAFGELKRVTFSTRAGRRVRDVLAVLNELQSSRQTDGSFSATGQALYEKHFKGNRAWFSDSSDTEKREFRSKLEFASPHDPAVRVFCPWHGKVSNPALRIHFEWPGKAGTPLFVPYVGPKITKR